MTLTVFRSFFVLGWLFTDFIPLDPSIEFNKKQFINIISLKLTHTFDDTNKQLFKSMLNIILNEPEFGLDVKNFYFGTNKFEYVWESIIDDVFGVNNKKDYFPKTCWHIIGESQHINSSLRPDTIMLYDNNIYVLDAKYYKYAYSKDSNDLPQSYSINKQITYGEYIHKISDNNIKIYNAFIMPFNAIDWQSDTQVYIGDAIGNWKEGHNTYEIVKGIMIDIKYLMKISGGKCSKEVKKLADLIQNSCIKSTS